MPLSSRVVDRTMRAVVCRGVGGPEAVVIAELPRPRPGPDDLLVRVHASALNRGDLLQRDGEYQVPEGQSSVLGVEVAGTVESCGERVVDHRPGDRVFGVVAGGGFAEYCLLDRGMANPIPSAWGFREAAATAEAWLTADETLFELGGLVAGQTVLVHASASGVGATMVQLARHVGARVYGTAGSAAKASAVRALGAEHVIDYRAQDFVPEVSRLTGGQGVDLVMDFIGGAWLERNLRVLRDGGRLILVGLLDGLDARLDMLEVVARRLQIKGSSLRLRPIEQKREVNRRFQQRWLARLQADKIRPVIHAEYPFEEIHAAQREMEDNRNVGKIVLRVRD
ncbi:MAG: NAD(P)H-quinone oxidoreductase [Micromonosporaceae bacterium]